MSSARVPVAEGLWRTNDDEPRLVGSRCDGCGETRFPVAGSCARCTGTSMTTVDLPTRGTLWSWTIQGFLPKNPPYAGLETPLTFVPYGVGYVELPGACIVESRLTENRPEHLRIGMPLRLVLIPFTTDGEGREVLTFAFSPED
jgi:uncharacterized protein